MDISKLREALGAAKDVPDANVIEQASAKLAAVPALETDKATALSRVTELEKERDAAKLELSRVSGVKPPDADTLRGLSEVAGGRIDLAVERGQITPGQATVLKRVAAHDGKYAPLMLSRTNSAEEYPIIQLLKEFEAVKPMQFRDAQEKLLLARQAHGNAGEKQEEKAVTPERKRELMELTPLGQSINAAK